MTYQKMPYYEHDMKLSKYLEDLYKKKDPDITIDNIKQS